MRLARQILTPVVFTVGMVLACLLSIGALIVLQALRPAPAPQAASTAQVNIIAAPTATLPLPTLPPTATPSPTPPLPGLAPLEINDYVQVAGTGDGGLRLRADPGLTGDILYVAIESEVFKVIDGPREVDGYTWWHLLEPYQQKVTGWAVGNYLALIQNP